MEDRILEPVVLHWDQLKRHWWSWVSRVKVCRRYPADASIGPLRSRGRISCCGHRLHNLFNIMADIEIPEGTESFALLGINQPISDQP